MLARLQRRLLLAEGVFHLALAAVLLLVGAAASTAVLVCVAAAVVGRLAWIVMPATIAGLPARAPRPWLLSLPGEWLAFTLTNSVLQPARALWSRWLDGPPRTGDRDALFVHGYCCNAAYWLPLRWRLRGTPVRPWHVDLEPVFGDIDDLALALIERVDAISAELRGPLVVVAHSMGGLVLRAAMVRRPDLPVRTVVTVGTPHAGTRLARLAYGRNAAQMRPASPWLEALPPLPESVRTLTVASEADELVTPTATALPGWADEQLRVTAVGHMALGWSSAVVALVERILCESPEA